MGRGIRGQDGEVLDSDEGGRLGLGGRDGEEEGVGHHEMGKGY